MNSLHAREFWFAFATTHHLFGMLFWSNRNDMKWYETKISHNIVSGSWKEKNKESHNKIFTILVHRCCFHIVNSYIILFFAFEWAVLLLWFCLVWTNKWDVIGISVRFVYYSTIERANWMCLGRHCSLCIDNSCFLSFFSDYFLSMHVYNHMNWWYTCLFHIHFAHETNLNQNCWYIALYLNIYTDVSLFHRPFIPSLLHLECCCLCLSFHSVYSFWPHSSVSHTWLCLDMRDDQIVQITVYRMSRARVFFYSL